MNGRNSPQPEPLTQSQQVHGLGQSWWALKEQPNVLTQGFQIKRVLTNKATQLASVETCIPRILHTQEKKVHENMWQIN